MVLELLLSPSKAEKRPWELLFLGALYASIAVIISMWVFMSEASLVLVFLTVLACIPLIHSAIVREEEKPSDDEMSFLKEHKKIISYLMFLFLGIVLVLTVWFVVLPSETSFSLFDTQIVTIKNINSNIVAGAVNPSYFYPILENNLKVLFFCIFFSFFYGAGAIFVLTWNASVIAAATGIFIRDRLGAYAGMIGMEKVAIYFQVFSMGILRYMTHGVFEILAYFVGGLAGGMISVAMLRHTMEEKKFKQIMLDAFNLIIIAIGILVIAGLVEVFVTPKLI